jgi:anti-sigma-K factor RskA
VANVLASDRLAVKPLQPAQAAAASTGYVFLDPASGTGMLMCHDLPPVQQGHAYQVWFIRGNDRVSGGMLWPDPRGDGYTMIQVPADVQSYDSIGLTDEPGSGSAWPTTPRVIGTPLKESSQ